MGKSKKSCSICKGVIDVHVNPSTGVGFWIQGHNAEPINSGRCCSDCNTFSVIPARIMNYVCKFKA